MIGQRESTPSAAAFDDANSFARRSLLRGASIAERHRRAVGVAALGGVLGIAAVAYLWTRAPLYNPSGTIDPWLYTALFVNFDQVYEHFHNTYYASRLPWVVPGRVAHAVLPVEAAYWVLHGFAFCGGLAALFFLIRRYLGLAPAVTGAATLALSPMYWNAQYWDYIDGVVVTYLLGGLCFGLPVTTGRARGAWLAVAGIFFAAAVTTNLFVALVALTYPIMYVFVQPAAGLRKRLTMALADLVALAAGATALVVALGLHARANGGPFIFFEAQINVIRGSQFVKQPGYEWLRTEPRLLVPVFLLAAALPLLVVGRRLPTFRFSAGSVAGLVFLTVVIYGWEFLAGGNVLELTYYFSYFAISIALTMASLAGLAAGLARSRRPAEAGVVAASTIAALVALGIIYRNERAEWTGWAGTKISFALIGVAAVLLVAFVFIRRRPIASVAAALSVGAIALASHFAINSSNGTFVFSYSAPNNGSLYHAAFDEVAFLKRWTTPDEPLPTFWYAAENRPDLIAIQSMYYWAFTQLDLALPKVTPTVRQRLDWFKPPMIVMLCESRDCGGGAKALRRAGYPYVEASATRISRGEIRLWSVLLRRGS
jgi:hypothetical protein